MMHVRTSRSSRASLARVFSAWTVIVAAGTGLLALGVGLMSLALAHPHPHPAAEDHMASAKLVNPAKQTDLQALLDEVQRTRAVMVGEVHDRYDHHLNQLAVIRGLHERGVPIAIGMECFQRPFQPHLDDFTAGRASLAQLLERTQWHQRWRFDVRLYEDILTYAQRQAIPLVALNAATETVSAVSDGGIEALDAEQRALFPPRIELAAGAYRAQLNQAFALHGDMPEAYRERFLQVQYVWDQTMARTAGDYLTAHPERTLVLLAGSGHLLHDDAIPARLRRINPAEQAVLVTDTGFMPAGAEPDYIFAARDLSVEARPQVAELD
ncbi:ChaN family lipoprotein [uncultured Thiohalocapsa sp.]|uniref:ChaN family lipoprotein n=1 Tax=uncultured Thiohalocapsa sp. TaxID=768990 RepID=UPI0025D96382|nr:ChaN family lipoprotein [uncultured Thiohalocapsa sp.]